jgi:hypothetical protein
MNATPPMNDDDALTAVRESLTAARDALAGVRMEHPVDAVIASGRARRARRSLAVRAAVACGTAAVIVAAVAVAQGPYAPARTAPGGVRAQTVAYVVQRMGTALAQANVVLRTAYTFSPAFSAIRQWSYLGNVRTAQAGFMPAAAVRGLPWAQGQESWAAGTTTINGKLAYVQVDYRRHQWYPTGAFGFEPSCSTGLNIVESNGPANWSAYIQQALSCGVFKAAGHARVNGKDTVAIAGSMLLPRFWTALGPHPEGRGALHVTATLYVDPSTYLPVRMIWRNWSQAVAGKPLRGSVREDITALPPTPANVAMASVTIPAGFRRVPDGSFGGPIFPYFG